MASTEDNLHVCRDTINQVETPIFQRKILSLDSSMFDYLGVFATFNLHMRQFLKRIWTKIGQHWANSVAPNKEEEFVKWRNQLPEIGETSIGRRYYSKAQNKLELHVFADASENTICAVAYLLLQPKEYSADLAFVVEKCRNATMRHLSIPRLELQSWQWSWRKR